MHTDFSKINCQHAVETACRKNIPYALYDTAELELFPAEWWADNLPVYNEKALKEEGCNWTVYYSKGLFDNMVKFIKELDAPVLMMAKKDGFVLSVKDDPTETE